jgi:hypothetical protein
MLIIRSSPLRRCLLDLALLVLALIVFITGEDGTMSGDTDMHQVLALIIGAGVAVHLIWQWRWIAGITARFFGKLPGRARLNYIVGAFLLITFLATFSTGLLASSWITDSPEWALVHLHHVAPKLFLLGVILHALLHWRWLVSNVRKLADR